ncbi:MAG TPA: sigma-54 dependent transcriptional regulator [Candidatus Binatia bacterium]|jgi:DNA-binding NtrC family response regulator
MPPNWIDKQPWVTCHLSDMLLSHIKATAQGVIDYPALFQGIEGFEIPSDPESFLMDASNWMPLSVLRELEWQCEKISGKKDFAYHAARAYFTSGRRPLPSLFEIIVQVLNDVRSALVFANLWGAAQTNYLNLQSFDKQEETPQLYILAQFAAHAKPGIASLHLLRGFSEGFPRLYPFIGDARCIEELSQVRIEDVVREFPDYTVTEQGDRAVICARASKEPVVEAVKVALKTETIPLAHEFMLYTPDALVAPQCEGQIEVLTREADPSGKPAAYRIVKSGALTLGSLTHAFEEGQIYNAPYCRFRFEWKEGAKSRPQIPADAIRKEVSRLLFEHLQQVKQTQIRMAQFTMEKARLTLENIQLRREIEQEYSFSGIVGQSKPMRELFGLVRSIAETDVTVLIEGETGTGKELIARGIHYNSPRRMKSFIGINCGALAETLLESELFGHEKGAFTGAATQRKGIFEAAHGGTLFLDEIGETSAGTQVKLLRVLQEGELQRVGGRELIKVDARVIAATNQNLEEAVKAGRFRQDLYYRLHVFPLPLPPLRDRTEDIPLLVSHFIEKSKTKTNKAIKGVAPQAMALLIAYEWPGNVRELENVIQRMVLIAKGELLDVADLPREIRGGESEARATPKGLKGIARESSALIEKKAIVDALAKTGGNVTRAAQALGVSRATLQNKMKAYGLRSGNKK